MLRSSNGSVASPHQAATSPYSGVFLLRACMARSANNLIIDVNCTDAINQLSDQDAGQLFKQLLKYNITGNYEKQGQIVDLMFMMMKPFIDDNKEAYNRKCSINKANGHKGGRPINEEKTERLLNKPNGYSENPSVIEKTERLLNKPSASKKSKEEYSKEEKENNTLTPSEFSFVLKNGNLWNLSEEKVLEYEHTYPNVNIEQELMKAAQWLKDNQSKRKTEIGMPRFLNSWLSRATPMEVYDPEANLPTAEEAEALLRSVFTEKEWEKEKAKELERRAAKAARLAAVNK